MGDNDSTSTDSLMNTTSNNGEGDSSFLAIERLMNRRFDLLEESNSEIKDELRMRNRTLGQLRTENRQLHERVRTLEDRLLLLEKQVNNTENNNRKNNVEIEGIPATVKDEDLRAVAAEIFNHVIVSDIDVSEIECAHRLYSKTTPKPTIVRLRRNFIDELKTKDAKTKLKDVGVKMGYPRGTKIYVNDNQSPKMKNLSFNARLLKQDGVIAETWFSNAAVRIKLTPTSKPLKITHEKDLIDNFPTYDRFTFDMDFYRRIQEDLDIEKYDDLSGNWSDGHHDSSNSISLVDVPEAELINHSNQTLIVSSPSSEEAASAKKAVIEHLKTMTNSHTIPPSPSTKKLHAKVENPRWTRSKTSLSSSGNTGMS